MVQRKTARHTHLKKIHECICPIVILTITVEPIPSEPTKFFNRDCCELAYNCIMTNI